MQRQASAIYKENTRKQRISCAKCDMGETYVPITEAT
jgi:hypothetical protein